MGFREEFITRHRDLISPDALGKKIVVIGAGAIGSFTVLALAKMGYSNIHVYDFDTVETENIGSQFYPVISIGSPKVEQLKTMVFNFTGIDITTHQERIVSTDKLDAHIVISAVDSMEVRKTIFEIANTYWIIDPRMAAEYASMQVCKLQDKQSRENYKRTLYTDEESVQERCTAKTTIYTVLLISGQIVKAVKDITMDNEPITTLDWSIRNNALLAFSNGRKL